MATSMWQQTEEMAKKHDQGGSLWLKLAADGDKAVVVFLGEPHPAHLEVRVGVDPGPDRRASRHHGEPAPDTQAAGREPSGAAGGAPHG